MEITLKEKLINACNSYVKVRTNRILSEINDLNEALKLETKCSMGDKYETGRAMLHLEFEKLSGQLEQFQKMKKTLTLINIKPSTGKAEFGSVVKTTSANYFIAIPAGEILIGEEKFYAIGAGSPIAQLLLGKKEGEHFSFNGSGNKILEVC